MRKFLEKLIHIPICADGWIPDTASTALTHENFQALQWIKKITEGDQSFLPKPGISAIVWSLSKPMEKFYLYFYIIFILIFILCIAT